MASNQRTQSGAQSQAKTQTQSQAKTQTQSQAKTQTQSQAKTQTQSQTQSQAKTQARPPPSQSQNSNTSHMREESIQEIMQSISLLPEQNGSARNESFDWIFPRNRSPPKLCHLNLRTVD